jgi:hypothetical protein
MFFEEISTQVTCLFLIVLKFVLKLGSAFLNLTQVSVMFVHPKILSKKKKKKTKQTNKRTKKPKKPKTKTKTPLPVDILLGADKKK